MLLGDMFAAKTQFSLQFFNSFREKNCTKKRYSLALAACACTRRLFKMITTSSWSSCSSTSASSLLLPPRGARTTTTSCAEKFSSPSAQRLIFCREKQSSEFTSSFGGDRGRLRSSFRCRRTHQKCEQQQRAGFMASAAASSSSSSSSMEMKMKDFKCKLTTSIIT